MAPSWMATRKVLRKGSSSTGRPRRWKSRVRWPVEETGRNSVSPSTTPSRRASQALTRPMLPWGRGGFRPHPRRGERPSPGPRPQGLSPGGGADASGVDPRRLPGRGGGPGGPAPGAEPPKGLGAVFLEGAPPGRPRWPGFWRRRACPSSWSTTWPVPSSAGAWWRGSSRPPKEAAPPSPSSPCPTPSWPRRGRPTAGWCPGRPSAWCRPPRGFHRPPPGGPRLRPEEGSRASDDAQLVQALGYPVALVEGEATAFKITHPQDLVLAEALARVWSA